MRSPSWTSLVACLGALSLVGGCAVEDDTLDEDPGQATVQSDAAIGFRLPLPSLTATPNIAAAAASLFGPDPALRAHFATGSGFQIYRCEANASGQPTWTLRTPLAHLQPDWLTQFWLPQISNSIHARSDLGGLLTDAELRAMGLLSDRGVRTTAPTWQVTFGQRALGPARRQPVRREVVAGRVVAQDATLPGPRIPALLVEVRGRSVSAISGGVVTSTTSSADRRDNPIASSDYVLRLSNGQGTAPDAASCTTTSLGQESQSYYTADYYFVDVQ